jgi:hypothetical protein
MPPQPQGACKMETLFVTDAELIRRTGVPERRHPRAGSGPSIGVSTEANAMGKAPLLACSAGLV